MLTQPVFFSNFAKLFVFVFSLFIFSLDSSFLSIFCPISFAILYSSNKSKFLSSFRLFIFYKSNVVLMLKRQSVESRFYHQKSIKDIKPKGAKSNKARLHHPAHASHAAHIRHCRGWFVLFYICDCRFCG